MHRTNEQIDLLRRPTLPLTVASGTRCKICLRNASYRESYPHAPQYSMLTTAGLPIILVQNIRVNVRNQNPDQLTCKCSGQILTNKIKQIIQSKNSSPSTSTLSITDSSIDTCFPSKPCASGKIICSKQSSYCTCQNGTWMVISCPEGSLCNTESKNTVSCQPTSTLSEKTFPSSSASSTEICEYFCIFLCWMLIK
ncbi:unnamed protein product [Adineta ricciae]|uniref:Uncharacterized protein n=1 Tax=Adineta ricciae TaxID=249248 RepID=A0A814ZR57_ADIRI|nr:unnamed protein product [Adineta ricciae]